MQIKSVFLKKYKKHMLSVMKNIFPDIEEKYIEKSIDDLITENLCNPKVELDNNFTGENRKTTLLSVLDWILDRKPIIAGNGTFYKNQYEAINPIAKMLKDFLSQRKFFKKEMFKIEDITSYKYKDLDRSQQNEKVNCNSYYGASGAKSSAFYSKWSGPATTLTAQSVISTTETLFEGFIADNYQFINLTECIEWCRKVLKYAKEQGELDSFIQLRTSGDLVHRLLNHIIDTEEDDEEILYQYIDSLSDEEITILYYKNNMMEFIKDHDYIQDLILTIFRDVENLEYADEEDEFWMSKLSLNKYREEFVGKTGKDWNKFVNKQYFMDPNDVPESIASPMYELSQLMMKYVYVKYMAIDRIYRLRNFKRKVVTVIDTDSNILSLDTIVEFLMDDVVRYETFGRDFTNNIFICINMLAYIITDAVTDILLTYGEYSNVPEEFRPLYNMKNEFLFLKLVIGQAKKRYMSRISLREGNLINPPKYDIKGFDFKKASCSEYAEEVYMRLIKKFILDPDEVDIRAVIIELNKFKNEIITSIKNGERTYLPNASAKELGAYKNPESEQSVRGVLAWNLLFPENTIELPSKVSLLKLNIFKEEDIAGLKDTYPEYYDIIMNNIFNDTTGIFVQRTWDNGIDYVSLGDKEFYKKIPKKYQSKYKSLGAKEWNKFVDEMNESGKEVYKGEWIYNKRGMQVLAIPSNAKIPEWIQPYIDYSTLVNNILSPFKPVLEIFKSRTTEEGKSVNGVNRKTEAFTNIIKF